jgi:hypothetical protein
LKDIWGGGGDVIQPLINKYFRHCAGIPSISGDKHFVLNGADRHMNLAFAKLDRHHQFHVIINRSSSLP